MENPPQIIADSFSVAPQSGDLSPPKKPPKNPSFSLLLLVFGFALVVLLAEGAVYFLKKTEIQKKQEEQIPAEEEKESVTPVASSSEDSQKQEVVWQADKINCGITDFNQDAKEILGKFAEVKGEELLIECEDKTLTAYLNDKTAFNLLPGTRKTGETVNDFFAKMKKITLEDIEKGDIVSIIVRNKDKTANSVTVFGGE